MGRAIKDELDVPNEGLPVGRILAEMGGPGPESTLILYAARPGETASNNRSGSHGLFTKHLLAVLDQPSVGVETAFTQVLRKVYPDLMDTREAT